jgi:hypothetical protein
MPRGENKLASSIGGLRGWLNTEDRAARIAKPHQASPSGWAWHARRLGYDPDSELTPEQRKRVEEHRRLWYAELSRKGRRARDRRYAERLRARADQAEARTAETAEKRRP